MIITLQLCLKSQLLTAFVIFPLRYEGLFSTSLFGCTVGRWTFPNGDYIEGNVNDEHRDNIHLNDGKGITKVHYDKDDPSLFYIHDGLYVKGKKNGFGHCTWSNGASYEGEYKDDVMHGKGKFRNSPGEPFVEGVWENGVRMQIAVKDIAQRGEPDISSIRERDGETVYGACDIHTFVK